jgi:uracil-DNA glycosylase
MTRRALLQQLEMLRNMGVREIYRTTPPPPPDLETLRQQYSNCTKCALHEGRTNFVYGEGNPHARAVLIGEGPGFEEDKTGRPFVGRAGSLLNDMLNAINLSREDVYICNVVKCRPPGNRDPLKPEAEACLPYLLEQISIIQPKLILMLGRIAAHTLLENDWTMDRLMRDPFTFQGIRTRVIYHPAALLRNPEWKKPTWHVLQIFRDEYLALN